MVEIPTGTLEKWEVDKNDGNMRHPFVNGKPRVVQYLGYPGNYGMIPQTLYAKEIGGDGDPLDIIALGASTERGVVIPCKLIGILHAIDRGEKDDKLIAVMEGSPFYEVNDIDELKEKFGGVIEILSIWLENYKGPGKMKIENISGKEKATEVLNLAIEKYKEKK